MTDTSPEIQTIQEYLEQLREALAGCDPALVQDALYDAGYQLACLVPRRLQGQGGIGTEDDIFTSAGSPLRRNMPEMLAKGLAGGTREPAAAAPDRRGRGGGCQPSDSISTVPPTWVSPA
jgi:hypothetical protein